MRMMKMEETLRSKIPDEREYITGFSDLTGLLDRRFAGHDYGVVIGKRLDGRIIDSIAAGPNFAYYDLYRETNMALAILAEDIAGELRKAGAKALPITPTPGDLDRAENYAMTLRNSFSHKMAGTRAGLGWIGKTDLFISERFGPRVRLVSVLTDYPLESSRPPVNESRCGSCRLCVEACPAGAANGKPWNTGVDRDEFYDAFKCRDMAADLSMKNLGREIRLCGICVSVCPVGKKEGDLP